jgi:hypothetical protein
MHTARAGSRPVRAVRSRACCFFGRAKPKTTQIKFFHLSMKSIDRRRCCYGPLTATPELTGTSADVLQRQPPLALFWNANAF